MAKCMKCNITIKDDTRVCPLCQRVLEPIPGETVQNNYPDIWLQRKKMALALRIYAFCAILAELLLILINHKTYQGIWWSAIPGVALLYAYVTLALSARKYTDLRLRILFQAISGIVFLCVIDLIYGFKGWSISFSYPFVILVLDGIVLTLMIIDHRNYQSYLWIQLFLCALSALPLIFYFNHFPVAFYPAVITPCVSVIEFIGTLVVGGQKARAELKRRFYA